MDFCGQRARTLKALVWLSLLVIPAMPLPAQDVASRVDVDQTADGEEQLGKLVVHAREIYRNRDRVVAQRQPLVLQRDPLAIRIKEMSDLCKQATLILKNLTRQAQNINTQLQNAQGNEAFDLKLQLSEIKIKGDSVTAELRDINRKLEVAITDLRTLDAAIAPLDKELARLWTDIEEVRGQWTDVRQPSDKFARGDYEDLYRAVDDWQRTDALWPEGYQWKALCAYELGDLNEAEAHITKADDLRTKGLGMTDPVAETEAVFALVHTRMGGKYAARAKERFSKATRLNNKQQSWFANFVMGRSYSEKEADATRAKVEFEKALKIQPKNPCAQIGLARLQTTAKKETVRDLAAGTQVLEAMWSDTGNRSWRLGYFLVEAYHASNRKQDAEVLWNRVQSMAPDREQNSLKERYAKLARGS